MASLDQAANSLKLLGGIFVSNSKTATTTVSATAVTLTPNTLVRITSDVDCFMKFGAAGQAVASTTVDMLVKAVDPPWYTYTGAHDELSVINGGAVGNIDVTVFKSPYPYEPADSSPKHHIP